MILRVLSTYHVGEKQMFLRVFRTVSRRRATNVPTSVKHLSRRQATNVPTSV